MTYRHPRDRRLPLLVGTYAVLYALANVGSITAPTLLKQRQLALLLALSSRMRHLLFSVPAHVSPVVYIVVPLLRIALAAAVCFLLGQHYGDRGMGWLERQLGEDKPATLRWLERGVDRAGLLVVFLMPGSNIVCLLAGYRQMRRERFAAAIIAGIAFRLGWIWIAANQFKSQLDTALHWIERYQWPLVAGFLGLTLVQSFRRAARRVDADAEAELAEVAALEDAAADEAEPR